MVVIARLPVKLKLITKTQEIEQGILNAAAFHLNSRLQKTGIPIIRAAKTLIEKAIKDSSEYKSLEAGQLRGELGVVSAGPDLDAMIRVITNGVSLRAPAIKVVGGRLKATYTLTAVPIDLEPLVSSLGTYETEKGTTIPWLSWLLTLGDKVIVREFDVDIGNAKNSRTGGTVMKRQKNRKGWRIPPQFSGTKTNNFVTRATDNILIQLGDVIEREVTRVI